MNRAAGVLARVIDELYAASDASHRARGWEVRKGQFGSRRYRLDVAAWLESRRRLEQFGSAPAPLFVVRDEYADLVLGQEWSTLRTEARPVAGAARDRSAA